MTTDRPSEGDTPAALQAAIKEADLSLALLDLDDFTVISASRSWLAHLGMTAESVIGRPIVDFIRVDKEAARESLSALRDGRIDFYITHRELYAPVGVQPMTTEWLRGFSIGDRRLALAQAAPSSDDTDSPIAEAFGREPAKMAIGTMASDFRITAVSCDVVGVLGQQPKDLIGKKLVDLVPQREAQSLRNAHTRIADAVGLTIHLRNEKARWVPLCFLITSFTGDPDCCFMFAPSPDDAQESSRILELEQHLWSIAAIVEASGVLQRIGPVHDMSTLPQVNNLTTRQWEVLARIVRGERVPTIAADLHVSQSTVRNHLSMIFKRFGVRSQPELLRAIETAGSSST